MFKTLDKDNNNKILINEFIHGSKYIKNWGYNIKDPSKDFNQYNSKIYIINLIHFF